MGVEENVTLALRYRPHTFNDIVGQQSVKVILEQMVRQDKVPTGLLFAGVRGTGKTTIARILSAALNCEEEGAPCTKCPTCLSIAAGNSLDVHEVDAASTGNVDDIRMLTEKLMYSMGGKYRLVLLDEAQSMSRAAFNALLKTLEEPPPSTKFILLTTEPAKILETVLSRLMAFEFRKISVGDITARLRYISEQEHLAVEPDLLLTIAERSNGAMRDAVMTLDQVTRVGVKNSAEFALLLGETDYGPDLVKAMLSGDHACVFEAIDAQLTRTGDALAIATSIVATLKDVLVLKGGGDVAKQGKLLEARREIAGAVEAERVLACLRVMWDLKTKVRVGDDPRTMLDLAAVMATEALAGKRAQAAQQSNGPPAKMTLSAMRQSI